MVEAITLHNNNHVGAFKEWAINERKLWTLANDLGIPLDMLRKLEISAEELEEMQQDLLAIRRLTETSPELEKLQPLRKK